MVDVAGFKPSICQETLKIAGQSLYSQTRIHRQTHPAIRYPDEYGGVLGGDPSYIFIRNCLFVDNVRYISYKTVVEVYVRILIYMEHG